MGTSDEKYREATLRRRPLRQMMTHAMSLKFARTLFEAQVIYNRAPISLEVDFFNERECDRAVPYLPGTPEKVNAMADRIARGVALFHEYDGPLDDEE